MCPLFVFLVIFLAGSGHVIQDIQGRGGWINSTMTVSVPLSRSGGVCFVIITGLEWCFDVFQLCRTLDDDCLSCKFCWVYLDFRLAFFVAFCCSVLFCWRLLKLQNWRWNHGDILSFVCAWIVVNTTLHCNGDLCCVTWSKLIAVVCCEYCVINWSCHWYRSIRYCSNC